MLKVVSREIAPLAKNQDSRVHRLRNSEGAGENEKSLKS
jgi:hypothetical protein